MINKIRNLFNKFKKGKDSEIEDEFDLETDTEEEFFEDVDDEIEEHEELLVSESVDDGTGDLPPMPMEEDTGEFQTDVIDLENGKLPLKERVGLITDNLKNKFAQFSLKKPKKMSVETSIKDITGKIKLPKSLNSKNIKLDKINWANIHNEFFHFNKRQSIHRAFQYSSLILLTFAIGKSIGIILTGSKDYKTLSRSTTLDINKDSELKKNHITTIRNAKLFKTEAKKVEEKPTQRVQTNLACTKADAKSRLPIKLINTIVLQDSVKSIASVQVRSDNALKELRVGEKIDNLAKIDKIERSKLIIKNLKTGTCESVENTKDQSDYSPIAVLTPKQSKTFKKKTKKIKGIENDGNDFTIEKSFMKEKMANISDILTQARGIQINNPDGTISFKIVDVQPGGIFAYLGIQDGDIITEINGQPISDLNAVMNLFGKITTIDKLGLNVKRNGVDTPQNYKFK